jgi:NAD(P)-dependent dehydrogenase (short-subunit alcohol dehydrogenase family)
MNFHDKIVLVTGGTGGLGREVTMAFLEAGASVVVTYQVAEEFAAVVAAAQSIGATPPEGVSVDVTDAQAVEKIIAGIVEKQGRLDILVNTVGGYAGGTNLWEVDPRTYDKMLQLNLKAGFVLARAVVPQMIRQNRGWIVNIASKAAFDHAAGGALYAASKAAALAMMDSLAAEVKPYNITVNSVLPSIIDTSANRKAMPGADFAKWPKPEEIARVILFLCSEEGRVIHGAAIPVYGKS